MNWLDDARDELREIGLYIAGQSSTERGRRIAVEIYEAADILLDHPFAGPVIDEDVTGRHRHLICYSYRIIYRVEDDEVLVVCVIHGARLLPAAVLRRR